MGVGATAQMARIRRCLPDLQPPDLQLSEI